MNSLPSTILPEGLLLIDKPIGVTSFDVVARVRQILRVQRVGHAGTLDPFASGILIVLVGRTFTRRSDEFMQGQKCYRTCIELGRSTDSHDVTGKVIACSDLKPSMEEIETALGQFRGQVWQVPPMFSAKSINGTRLYKLARRGEVVWREPVQVEIHVQQVSYLYPHLVLQIISGKGVYIRAVARDLGKLLGCGAHLKSLVREKSGEFDLSDCFEGKKLFECKNCDLKAPLLQALLPNIK